MYISFFRVNVISDDQLHLKTISGHLIAHKDLSRYNKQYLIRRLPEHTKLEHQKRHRLGWSLSNDTNPMTKASLIQQRQQLQSQKYHKLRIGVKANKLQRHFRQELLQ